MTPHRPHRLHAFTWIEAIVCVSIIGILAALALPAITGTSCGHGGLTQTLSNMKQLHLATTQMALDGTTTGDTNLGFPGAIGGTFTNWVTQLATNGYLSTNDLCKLLSAPGKIVRSGKLPTRMSDTALIVYAISTNSAGSTVFLTSANFTNTPTGGSPLVSTAKPYGKKGYVLFRAGGDGAILLARQIGPAYTNIIGSYAPPCR